MEKRSLRRHGLLAWLHLMRIVRRTERAEAQRLRAWELSLAQFDVLAQLGGVAAQTQQDLAARLFVTQGNITQLLDRLEERGLVRRCPEGRVKRLELTEAGRQLHDSVVPDHEAWLIQRFGGLSPAEVKELVRLLGKLDRSLREEQG